MKKVSRQVVAGFVMGCREAARHGLMRCSSGNLSMRVNGDKLLVKSSRSWMERITPREISLCRLSDGSLIEGRKPSVEIGFHAGILRARPDINVVMHFQTPCATALACQTRKTINFFVIPEIPFYIGQIARVPCLPPGSKALALAVTAAMQKHDMVMMTNHGQVTVAHDIDHAIQNAVFFELACEIILRSGPDCAPLPGKDAQALLGLRESNNGNV